jgi:uncharacterized membrane protein
MQQALKPHVNRFLLITFWGFLILLSVYFYYSDAIAYFFGYKNPRFGDTLLYNQLWFALHIAGATCSLFLGPIQFWKAIRTKYTRFHRIAGKIYIIGSLVAAVTAFRLALIFDCVGCRYSLIPLSILFFFTTALAWYAIKQRNITAHRQFMVRSYVCALAFVFVRMDRVLPIGFIFDPIVDDGVYAVIAEWTFSILPLIVAEIFLTWIPSLRKSNLPMR